MEKTIVLSDMHAPHHDKNLLRKILAYAEESQPTGIVILGDFLDMSCFAKFNQQSLRKLKMFPYDVELKVGNSILDQLDKIGSVKNKHFLYGNHENRIDRWLDAGDNGILEGHIDLPEDALHLADRGWNVLRDWKEDFVQLGSLQVIHGMFCNLHSAKKHVELYGDVMYGHTHRLQTFNDRGRTGYNIGFLGDINSVGFRYISRGERAKWCNAFATVHHTDTEYFAEVHEVSGGCFCAGGKVY